MDSGSIKVFLRVRPKNEKQEAEGLCIDNIGHDTIKIKQSANSAVTRFAFDRVFGMQSKQSEVFEEVGKTLVDYVFEGINGTAFTYGQTSSGKTYTCMGPDIDNNEHKGLIPRLIQEVFSRIEDSAQNIEFRLKVSLVEIYQEKVRDLLDTMKGDLKIRQNKSRGIYIQDVTEKYVAQPCEVINLIKQGSLNRALGHTNMNDASSRSHMVFILTIHQNNLTDLSAKSAKLTLVDLAGSQKISKTGASGLLLDEAKQINKSLSALGNVINALTQTKLQHIPYRDSKLTRILQESLGGNAKTNLIINISPSILNEAETVGTLRFGQRAKNIKNKPKVNKEYTVPQLLLLLEKAEAKILEQGMIIKKLSNGTVLDTSQYAKNRFSNLSNADMDDQPQTNFEGGEVPDNPSEQASPPQQGIEIDEINRLYSKPLEVKLLEKEQKMNRLKYELERLQQQRTQLTRDILLLNERCDSFSKQSELLQTKLDQTTDENLSLHQKIIQLDSKLASTLEQNNMLESTASAYQKLKQQVQVVKRESRRNSQTIRLFGQFSKICAPVEEVDEQEEDEKEQLKKKLELLETQLAKYVNLKADKEKLEIQRQRFESERDGLSKDLQNRIYKVIELQEQLDFEKSKRQHLQDTISLQDKSQASKITALQSFISELTASYYVLKNQQLCWQTDTRIYENIVKRKTARIQELQREVKSSRSQLVDFKRVMDDPVDHPTGRSKTIALRPNNLKRSSEAQIIKVIRPKAMSKRMPTIEGLSAIKQNISPI